MLKQLTIQNYALIQNLELSFGEGLTIITGETGAGKSIMLGGLGLVLGKRADFSVLQDKNKKCVVEVVFDLSNYSFQSFFADHDLDFENQTLIRREINPQGKSRAFINDTPVRLEILKSLGLLLVDVHSQHQSLLLGDLSFQLEVIDAIAGNAEDLRRYQSKFDDFKKLEKEWHELEEKSAKASEEVDFLNFQYKELEDLSPVEGEQDALEKEQKMFSNLENIKSELNEVSQSLSEQEGSVVSVLAGLKSKLDNLSNQHEKIKELNDRFKSAFLELDDIASEIQQENENLVFDPERAQLVEDRLSAIYHLEQKHRVNSVGELLEIMHAIDLKLNKISSYEDELKHMKQQIQQASSELRKIAGKLSTKRAKAFPEFKKKAEEIMAMLGMPNATIDWKHEKQEELHRTGLDKVEMLFSANKGSDSQAINKVASGGELSRLMLSIKSILADYKQLPTIIFDEIDSGVSGDIADKMGNILKKMGQHRQVISITHLPQLAAKGQHHYFVYKETNKEKTVSAIKQLTEAERIDHLAVMLSGSSTSQAALDNAKELLKEE